MTSPAWKDAPDVDRDRALTVEQNKFHSGNGSDGKHYWLTPPNVYASLQIEKLVALIAVGDFHNCYRVEHDDLIAEARAVLAAPAVPEGYVLVPIEPTEAMSNGAWAGFHGADFMYLRHKLSLHDVRRLFVMFYKAMTAVTKAGVKP